MLLIHPRSTLFPYTTLFRSRRRETTQRLGQRGGIVGRHHHAGVVRSEEHTSELQSRFDLVCRLLLEKKKTTQPRNRRRPSDPKPRGHGKESARNRRVARTTT